MKALDGPEQRRQPPMICPRGASTRWTPFVSVVLIVGLFVGPDLLGQSQAERRTRGEPTAHAPTWFNTAGPLRLDGLRGKIVLVHWWSADVPATREQAAVLETIRRQYPTVVIVGVHRPRHPAEADDGFVEEAIRRTPIGYPVVNDARNTIAQSFPSADPGTVVLIGTDGQIEEIIPQADIKGSVLVLVQRLVQMAKRNRQLRPDRLDPLPIWETEQADPLAKSSPLRFPADVLVRPSIDRIYIADSGHHRIVVTDLNGRMVEVLGDGVYGRRDGLFAQARWHAPTALTGVGSLLVVAEAGSHQIRIIDFKRKRVRLWVQDNPPSQGTPEPVRMRRPSAIAFDPNADRILLTTPEARQILTFSRSDTAIRTLIDAMETNPPEMPVSDTTPALNDQTSNPSLAIESPSPGHSPIRFAGLIVHESRIYATAPRLGALLEYNVESESKLTTLFPPTESKSDSEGGDDGETSPDADAEVNVSEPAESEETPTEPEINGPPETKPIEPDESPNPATVEAPGLIHPTGIAKRGSILYIADTYGHAIKQYDLETKTFSTLVGGPDPGVSDQPPRFRRPRGLWVAKNQLYVADSGNHAIRVINLKSKAVSTLVLEGLEPPRKPVQTRSGFAKVGPFLVPVTPLSLEGPIELELRLGLPPRFALSERAPVLLNIRQPEGDPVLRSMALTRPVGARLAVEGNLGRVTIPFRAKAFHEGNATMLVVQLSAFVVSEADPSWTSLHQVTWRVPILFRKRGQSRVVLGVANLLSKRGR